jgi:hypothetical protein
MSAETFEKVASGVNSIAATIAIVAAGVWALTRFSVLLEARIAVAEADRAEAEATIAKRNVVQKEIVNVGIAADVLASKSSKSERWVSVAVTLRNSGSLDYVVDLEKNVRFYVARVLETKDSGQVVYGNKMNLSFDYADKELTWFNLKPNADSDVYQAIKRLDSKGLYIARFSVEAPKIGEFPSREYSAQTYFIVN